MYLMFIPYLLLSALLIRTNIDGLCHTSRIFGQLQYTRILICLTYYQLDVGSNQSVRVLVTTTTMRALAVRMNTSRTFSGRRRTRARSSASRYIVLLMLTCNHSRKWILIIEKLGYKLIGCFLRTARSF